MTRLVMPETGPMHVYITRGMARQAMGFRGINTAD